MWAQVGNYKLLKSLGKGAFGEVFLTQKIGQNGVFATKKLNREYSEKEENIKRLSNEIKILKYIHHNNITGLIDLMKTNNNIYIVMEYCNGGDLTKCLKKYTEINKRPFSEEIVQYLMKQIITGLDFLHSKNILHRDLKLDNILICFKSDKDKNSVNMLQSTAKITDFGFSKIIEDPNNPITFTLIGTPIYMSPGMVAAMANNTKNPGYNQKADIWSLGVLCYEMIIGKCPFIGNSILDLYNKIKEGNYELPNYISHEAALFIGAMLVKDENKRLSCKELLKHDFLTKNYKDFKPLNIKEIPGVISQKDGFVIINSGINQLNNQLPVENKKDNFNQVKTVQKEKDQIKQNNNSNININKPNNSNNQNPEKHTKIQNNPKGNQTGPKYGQGLSNNINPYKSSPIFYYGGSI